MPVQPAFTLFVQGLRIITEPKWHKSIATYRPPQPLSVHQLLRSNPYHGLITTSSFSSITRQILIRRGSLSDFDIPALLTPVYHWTNGHGAAGFGAPLSVSRSTPNFRLTSSEGGSTCISSLLYDPLDQGRQTPTLGITLIGLKEHNISSSSKCALPGLVIGWSLWKGRCRPRSQRLYREAWESCGSVIFYRPM